MCLSVKSTCSDLFYFKNEWHVLIFIINTIQSTELRRMPFSIHKLSLFRYCSLYYRGLRAFRWLRRQIYNMLQFLEVWSAKTRHPLCKFVPQWYFILYNHWFSESHLYFFFVCANPFNTLDIPVSAFESQLPNVTQS